MSKLSIWNFTIFDMTTDCGYCHIWNETIGNRGSNEVASFVLKFIEEKVLFGYDEFVFYTDSCGGQNRNKNLYSAFVRAANKHKIKIIQR